MQRPKAGGEPLRWDDIQMFVALLQQPSLTRAGAALGVDTSTLSRRLAALERRLGLALFDRTSTGLRITAAAEKLATAARAMETSALTFGREAENFERKIEGLVRLSAPPGVIEGLIVPAMPRLQARYSRVVVELDADTRVRDLTRRETDIAIRSARPASGALVCKKVYTGGPWPLGTLAYVRELGTLRSLSEARWVGHDDASAHLDPSRGAFDLPPPVLRSPSQLVQIRAAAQGVGLVWTSRHFAYTFGLAPARVTPRLRKQIEALPPLELWLVAHETYRTVPRLAAVWAFLEEEFKELDRTALELDRAATG